MSSMLSLLNVVVKWFKRHCVLFLVSSYTASKLEGSFFQWVKSMEQINEKKYQKLNEHESSFLCLCLQGHLSNICQLSAGLHPRWSQEAVCKVRLSPKKASVSAALYQSGPGQPDIPLTLLCLSKHAQKQVQLCKAYSQRLIKRKIQFP